MIPDFNENGELPEGIHEATLEEVQDRFCINFKRKQLFRDFLLLMKEFQKIDCKDIYIDGSFTSNIDFPNDVDVCWGTLENASSEYFKYIKEVAPDLHYEIDYFGKCHIQPAYYNAWTQDIQNIFYIDFFQISKIYKTPKGIIKLISKC